MTRNKLLLTLALALSCVARPRDGARREPTYDRFQLFNECGPMKLVVEDYKDEAYWADIGLTMDRLQTMAESRLRARSVVRRHGGALPVRQRERCACGLLTGCELQQDGVRRRERRDELRHDVEY